MRDLKNKNNNVFRELSHQSRFVLKTTYSYHFRSFTQLLKCFFLWKEKKYRNCTEDSQGKVRRVKQNSQCFFQTGHHARVEWITGDRDGKKTISGVQNDSTRYGDPATENTTDGFFTRRCRIKALFQHTFLFSQSWVPSLPSDRVCK